MFNKEFSNQELNDEQLDNLTNPLAEGELSDEDLENVDGGFWGYYNYNSYASPYAYLNSYNWGATQALLGSAAAGFAARDAQHAAFMGSF